MRLHSYLFFTGRTRAAMSRYQEILGGDLEIMGLDDLPPGEDMTFESSDDFVVHAALTFGDGDLLMASDDPSGAAVGMKGAALSLTLDDPDEVVRVFDALAEGGSIEMPLGPTFWSPSFGSCVDRFGVVWMVSLDDVSETSGSDA